MCVSEKRVFCLLLCLCICLCAGCGAKVFHGGVCYEPRNDAGESLIQA